MNQSPTTSERVPVTYEMLRDRLGIVDTVYHAGTPREYFTTLCPWHDDHNASLTVHPVDYTVGREHEGYWRCLAGCGMGGIDALYRKLQKWERANESEVKARRKRKASGGAEWHPPVLPTDAAGMTVKAETAAVILQRYPELGWYLEQRGLKDRIEPRSLGYMAGWISIPVYNPQGEIETLILRATPAIQNATGARYHSPALPPKLYVPNWANVGRRDKVYVVFGMLDALSLDEINLAVCCSTHGNQSLNPYWFMGPLWRNKQFVLVSDDPEHERQEVREKADAMLQLGLRVRMSPLVYPTGCKDPNDILKLEGPVGLIKRLEGALG